MPDEIVAIVPGVLGEERGVLPGAVLEHEGDAAGGAHPGDGRRREREHVGAGQPGEPPAQVGQEEAEVEALRDALVPGVEGDEVEGAVGRRRCRW